MPRRSLIKMNQIQLIWRKKLLFFVCLAISSFDGMISTTISYFPSENSFPSTADQISAEQGNDLTIHSTGIYTEYQSII